MSTHTPYWDLTDIERSLAYLPPEVRPIYRAAPDLLEALKDCARDLQAIVYAMGDDSNPMSQLHAETAEKARAAIAKAEGK